MPQAPVMRRCEWIVRPPSKRIIRCFPCTSIAYTLRPASRSAQPSFAWRGCGVSIVSISLPISAAPMRLAAERIVSPSGIDLPVARDRAEPATLRAWGHREAADRPLTTEVVGVEQVDEERTRLLGDRTHLPVNLFAVVTEGA